MVEIRKNKLLSKKIISKNGEKYFKIFEDKDHLIKIKETSNKIIAPDYAEKIFKLFNDPFYIPKNDLEKRLYISFYNERLKHEHGHFKLRRPFIDYLRGVKVLKDEFGEFVYVKDNSFLKKFVKIVGEMYLKKYPYFKDKIRDSFFDKNFEYLFFLHLINSKKYDIAIRMLKHYDLNMFNYTVDYHFDFVKYLLKEKGLEFFEKRFKTSDYLSYSSRDFNYNGKVYDIKKAESKVILLRVLNNLFQKHFEVIGNNLDYFFELKKIIDYYYPIELFYFKGSIYYDKKESNLYNFFKDFLYSYSESQILELVKKNDLPKEILEKMLFDYSFYSSLFKLIFYKLKLNKSNYKFLEKKFLLNLQKNYSLVIFNNKYLEHGLFNNYGTLYLRSFATNGKLFIHNLDVDVYNFWYRIHFKKDFNLILDFFDDIRKRFMFYYPRFAGELKENPERLKHKFKLYHGDVLKLWIIRDYFMKGDLPKEELKLIFDKFSPILDHIFKIYPIF